MRVQVRWLALLAACSGPTVPSPSGNVSIEITSPMPGAELVADEAPTIVVTGRVATTTSAGVLEAWVDGARVELDADGGFWTEVAPELGINHVHVEASDGYTTGTQQLDVMWAPDYLPVLAGTTGFDVPGALDLELGQSLFDGRLLGTTLDLTTDPVVAHDLAGALELILWQLDLASLLSGGIHFASGSSSLDITLPSATPGAITVDARVVDSPDAAIELDIALTSVLLETDGSFQFNTRTLVIDGGLTADMRASVRLPISVGPDGAIAVTATAVTATIGPLVPTFVGPDADELNAFIIVGNNDFRALVEEMIKAKLIPTFTERLPPLLEVLLGATDSVLDNVTFTLDTGLGTPVTAMLDAKPEELDVAAGPAIGVSPGHVTVHQLVSIRTAGQPLHASSRGAPRVVAQPDVPATTTSALQVLMKHDFLNALVHALWNGGLLDGTTQLSGITATVNAKLPPFLRPTPDGSACEIDGIRCDMILQLGQLEVELPDFDQSFAISARAGARVVIEGTTVSLVVQDVPEVVVWETSAVPGQLSPEAIRDLVVKLVWPELFGGIAERLKLTLPLPDLAALGLDSLAPGLANAKLTFDVRRRALVSNGYLGLGAGLTLETPPPP